jgi:hypothetical protein
MAPLDEGRDHLTEAFEALADGQALLRAEGGQGQPGRPVGRGDTARR